MVQVFMLILRGDLNGHAEQVHIGFESVHGSFGLCYPDSTIFATYPGRHDTTLTPVGITSRILQIALRYDKSQSSNTKRRREENLPRPPGGASNSLSISSLFCLLFFCLFELLLFFFLFVLYGPHEFCFFILSYLLLSFFCFTFLVNTLLLVVVLLNNYLNFIGIL